MKLTKNIYIHPSSGLINSCIKDALARLVPVRFTDCAHMATCRQADAVISLSGDGKVLESMARESLRCFHVAEGTVGSKQADREASVRFGNSKHLNKWFRGRTVAHRPLPSPSAVRTEVGDEILACHGENPVWVFRRLGGLSVDIVSAPLPRLADGQRPFDYLDGYHFIQLLPLLHFLREVTTDAGWRPPPLRACLMFDDPNLHWPTYGFLAYREIATLAQRDGFHVAFATVPLDLWGIHARTANLFRENRNTCRCWYMGTTTPERKFGQVRTPAGHLKLIAQGLVRIARLEQKTGLHVGRVMVPPHEALAAGALDAMLSLGFEGASLTPWSLRYWNRDRRWPPTFGLEIAEMMNSGFPIISRFDLSGSCEGPAAISAFLGRPIVLFEHNEAMASGLEPLSRAAEVVNSLGDVGWCSVEKMLRSNYLTFQQDGTLWIKPYSSRVHIDVPTDVSAVVVVVPHETDRSDPFDFAMIMKREGTARPVQVSAGTLIEVVPGDRLELVSPALGRVDYRQIDRSGFSGGALARRILCEARDRFIPLMSRKRNPKGNLPHQVKRNAADRSAFDWLLPGFLVVVPGLEDARSWILGPHDSWSMDCHTRIAAAVVLARSLGEGGSPIDTAVDIGMIAGSVAILQRRGLEWGPLVSRNKALFLMYAYFALSVCWSEFPFLSLKRIIKDFGAVLMALVFLTEPNPIEAIQGVFARVAYVLFPLSVVAIKWFPEIGRMPRNSGDSMFRGLTPHKNMLGALVFIVTLIILWDLTEAWKNRTQQRGQMRARIGILLVGAWLMIACDSKTSFLCLVLGTFIFWAAGRLTRMQQGRQILIAGLTIAIGMVAMDKTFGLSGMIIKGLGRDPNLTGRTAIWRLVKEQGTDPFIGNGFYSFWDGSKGKRVSDQFFPMTLKSSHNGYLELYVDGGFSGIFRSCIAANHIGEKSCQQVVHGKPARQNGLGLLGHLPLLQLLRVQFLQNAICCGLRSCW